MDENHFLPGQLDFGWGSPENGEVEEQAALPKTQKHRSKKKAMKKKSVKASKKTVKAKSPAPKKKTKAGKSKPAASAKPVAKKKATKTKKAKSAAQPTKKTTVKKPPVSSKKAPPKAKKKVAKSLKSVAAVVPKSASPKPAASRSSKVSYHESVEAIDMKWGSQFPTVGFGFWKVEKEKTADVCKQAIKVGYRHLDCACDYGNEGEVGQGIKKAIDGGLCEREDLWVTSKLWNTYHAPEHVLPACERSLNDLGLDYLDLYLIHFPLAQRYVPFETAYPPGWFFDPTAPNPVIEEARVPVHETWAAMEELAKSGLVRNIGICNFGTSQIRDLLSYAKIRPAVLQVETHPYLAQEKLLRYCQQQRIAYTAFSPLGAQSYFTLGMAKKSESVMQSSVVKGIAKATGKTTAQVLLRWGVQRGTAVIPKTSSVERMVENIDIFSFELTTDQMAAISALDQGRRFNDPGHFGEAAFNTFLPIYE